LKVILLVFSIFIVLPLYSQDQAKLNVYNVNTENYPEISAEFLLLDQFGQQIQSVTPSDFYIDESGVVRQVDVVSCPPPPGKKDISVILIIDVSTSMEGERLQRAKEAGKNLVTKITERGGSEVGIIAFADDAFIVSGFTDDQAQLTGAIDVLVAKGGTNYQNAFLDPLSGAVSLSESAQHETHIFFLTDGYGKVEPGAIILGAATANLVVHSLAYNIELPEVLEEISDNTGGLSFNNLVSQEELADAFDEILNYAFNSARCTMKWQTEGCLTDRDVSIIYKPITLHDDFTYYTDAENLAYFFYPLDNFLVFETPGILQIGTEAKNGDIRIDSIKSSHPYFKVISPSIDDSSLLIPEGDDVQIYIEYDPGDPSLASSIITIYSSSCRFNEIYVIGGDDGTSPSLGGLELVEPVGGEIYLSAADTLVRWEGVLPSQEIEIEFSRNDGLVWEPMSEGAIDLSEDINYPSITSDECLIRVSQKSSDFGKKIYGKPDILYSTIDLSWDRTGDVIALADTDGRLRIINSVNGKTRTTYEIAEGLNSVDYSYDNIRIATANAENVFVTNTISSLTDTVIKIPGGRISDIKFHQNGRLMALGTRDSVLDVYDIRNWTLQQRVKFDNGEVLSVDWSPDGEKIAVTTNNIQVHVIDTNFYDTPMSIDATDITRRLVTAVSWSPDSRYIAVSTNQRQSKIIDVNTGEILNEFRHHTVSLLNDIAWNPSRDMVVSIAEDSRSIVFDPNESDDEAAVIYDFPNNYYFNSVEWSPNGERFAVALSNQLEGESVILYSVDEFVVQSDVSGRFRLVQNDLKIANVDVGSTPIGLQLDHIESGFIVNNGSLPVEIDSVSLGEIAPQPFDVSGNVFPKTLNPGDSLGIFIQFLPESVGIVSSEIQIYSNAGVLDATIIGEGIDSELRLLLQSIDFGEVIVGASVDSTLNIVYNKSLNDIAISSVSLLPIPNTPFEITSNQNSLQTNDSLLVTVEFTPQEPGIFQNLVAIDNDSPLNPARIRVGGIGVRPVISAPLSIDLKGELCQVNIKDSILIKNTGVGTLVIKDISYSGVGQVLFEKTTLTIPNKDSSYVSYTLEIEPGVVATGLISISSNSQMTPSPFEIDFEANVIVPKFLVESNTVFPATELNSQSTKIVTVRNTGSSTIDWDYLPLTDLFDGFELVGINPKIIQPNQTSEFTFNFNSGDTEGQFEKTFLLADDCSDTTKVVLSVIVGGEVSLIDHEALSIVDTIRCFEPITLVYQVVNTGNRDMNIDGVTVGDQGFIVMSPIPNILLSGDSLKIEILYNPQQIGRISSQIVVQSDAANPDEDDKYFIPIDLFVADEGFILDLVELDFLEVGDTADLLVTNTGNIEIFPIIELPIGYDILTNLPLAIGVGQTELVTIRLSQDDIPDFSPISSMKISTCNYTNVTLKADSKKGLISISGETRNINSGEAIDIAININSSISYPYPLELLITTNRTLLRPSVPSNSDKYVGYDYTHSYLLDSLSAGITNLKVNYSSAWGSDTASSIRFAIPTIQPDWVWNATEGLVIFDDICRFHGGRLFIPDYLQGVSISHNSSQLLINYSTDLVTDLTETPDQFSAEISIFTVEGRLVSIKEVSIHQGINQINHEMSSGRYFLIINTNNSRFSTEPYLFYIN